MIILFWALVILLAFAIALAAQMRMMISLVLRKALADKFGGYPIDPAYRAEIMAARKFSPQTEYGHYLETEYPRPLSHLALARRVSLLAPLLLLAVVLAGRFTLGVF